MERNYTFELFSRTLYFNLLIVLTMTNLGDIYRKEMSEGFTSTPDQVQFHQQKFVVQKTWKIGVKKDCDMTREEFIQELEKVNMFVVN